MPDLVEESSVLRKAVAEELMSIDGLLRSMASSREPGVRFAIAHALACKRQALFELWTALQEMDEGIFSGCGECDCGRL
ncbi:MAG: hypothetical protein N2315_05095 [Thermanaerothrix sp.]|nr:hypothetical protein [Thermanaerothrix sp.]